MNVMQTVQQEVEHSVPGSLLSYKDISVETGNISTLIKALSTLSQQGILCRLSKGLYYKPLETRFGSLAPDIRSMVNQLLERQKNQLAYITGVQAFNRLGLTRQISKDYVIATDRPRSPIQMGSGVIHFVKSRVTRPVSDIELLQVLDAFQNVKKIPDTLPEDVLYVLQGRLKGYTSDRLSALTSLALNYPPSTRALLGVIIDGLGEQDEAKKLNNSLNPTSVYRLGINMEEFSPSLCWHLL